MTSLSFFLLSVPSSTFFNLPDSKRQIIVDHAIAEFANHDYDNASISNIVKQSRIAKGSFYQYFEGKQDLYLYLVDAANQSKMDFIQCSSPPESAMGFFAYLRWLFQQSVQFDLSHPTLSQMINRAVYKDFPFQDEVLKRIRTTSSQYIHQLVKQGIQQGDINPDIDSELTIFIITILANGLRFFIPQRLGLTSTQLTQSMPPPPDMEVIEQIFDDIIHVLEFGLGNLPQAKE